MNTRVPLPPISYRLSRASGHQASTAGPVAAQSTPRNIQTLGGLVGTLKDHASGRGSDVFPSLKPPVSSLREQVGIRLTKRYLAQTVVAELNILSHMTGDKLLSASHRTPISSPFRKWLESEVEKITTSHKDAVIRELVFGSAELDYSQMGGELPPLQYKPLIDAAKTLVDEILTQHLPLQRLEETIAKTRTKVAGDLTFDDFLTVQDTVTSIIRETNSLMPVFFRQELDAPRLVRIAYRLHEIITTAEALLEQAYISSGYPRHPY